MAYVSVDVCESIGGCDEVLEVKVEDAASGHTNKIGYLCVGVNIKNKLQL